MIGWQIHDSFEYVPLNVNCIAAQGPACPLGHFLVGPDIAVSMRQLCEQPGRPIVFDYAGINISEPRAFEVFSKTAFARPVLLINVSDFCLSRLRDDRVRLIEVAAGGSSDAGQFWAGSQGEPALVSGVTSLGGQFVRQYLMSKRDALVPWGKTLPSTPVHASQYYDVKRLCFENNTLQVIATGIATAVLREKHDFDLVVASSNTGSLIAVPVSILLGKALRCWTDLGPSFRPKRRMEWLGGKGRKCLLVADVICMGTEARTAQAFLAAVGSTLIACAAVAVYLTPNNMPCHPLLDRTDLETLGYHLSIPDIGERK